jgi:hypothetical protein
VSAQHTEVTMSTTGGTAAAEATAATPGRHWSRKWRSTSLLVADLMSFKAGFDLL